MSEPSDQEPKKRRGCWYAGVWVAVLLAIGSYYAFCAAWEGANRMHCAHQLQQIGLAMHCYHDKYGCFPPAYVADAQGRRLHSWRVLLLPYLEGKDDYNDLRLNEPWDSPYNCEVLRKTRAAQAPTYYFHCCSAANAESETSYVMIVGPGTISDGPHSVRLEDIKDGLSNTILIVEVKDSGIHWAEPRDLDFKDMSFRINDPNGKGIGGYHPGIVNVAFADGSVRSISNEIDPQLVKSLITINGGEDVSEFFRNQ